MIKSILISSFILLSATVIESSILSNIAFLYVIPDFVLICTIYFALLNGKIVGESTGFISGLFLDFVSGVPFGFNCLIRTIIGYIYGFFYNSIIITGFVMPILTVGAGTILKVVLTQLVVLFFPHITINTISLFSYEFLIELGLNILLAPVVFKFLGFFKNSLSIVTTKDKVDNVQ